jgi:hypothetical protein
MVLLAPTAAVFGVQVASSAAGATSSTFAPSSYTTVKGRTGGEPVANLAAADGAAVTFGPGAYRGDRVYQLPNSLAPSSIWGITVRVVWRGPTFKSQHAAWEIYDAVDQTWDALGDNTDATSTTNWQSLTFYAGGSLVNDVDPTTHQLHIRLHTTKKGSAKPIAIDSESVSIDSGARPANPGWKPPVGVRWQYQLQGDVVTNLCVAPWVGGACVRPQAYDVDEYANDGVTPNTASVAAIHAQGAKAICYVDAGSSEDFRPDANEFPASVKGRSNGWPGEKWLDIRQTAVLLPIMQARVQKCVTAGFDAVEFDNVDGYSNHTGFPLSGSDQIVYDRALAGIAHTAGLSVGLKNDVGQLTQLFPYFDFAINEQCHQYNECGGYNAWTSAGKAVVEVEYAASPDSFCADAIANGRSAIHKELALEATPWQSCN